MTAVAPTIDKIVARKPIGTVFTPDDFPGSRTSVYTALNRAVDRGALTRLRNGVYYKGHKTRYGMTRPQPLDAGVAIAGPGAGPAGLTAANLLGLTTQVPAITEVAVPGRAPAAPRGVKFTTRPARRIAEKLTNYDIAVVEVLRMWPSGVEVDDATFTDIVRGLVADRKVSVDRVTRTLDAEHVPAARTMWRQLLDAITP